MNELKVGLLALAAIISLIFMSLKITSNQSGFGSYVGYQTKLADAAGIFPKTPIRIAGINVGRIKSIALDKGEAVIHFEVLESVKITKDSTLVVKTVGFLGDKYLEIVLGEQNILLEEGGLLANRTGGGMEDLTKDASDVLKDLKFVMKSIRNTLAPEGKESPLSYILNNAGEISQDIKLITKSLRTVLSGNETKINNTLSSLENLTSSLDYELDAGNQESLMAQIKQLGPILSDLKLAMGDVREIVGDTKSGKGSVGKLLRDEQVVDQVSQTLSSVQKLVGKVETIQTEISLYSAVNTEDESQTSIDLKIYPSPDRFYLLGVSTAEKFLDSDKEITTEQNGVKTTLTRREYKNDTLVFNLQLGRKINNWSFRGGLIESSGGLGVDYFLSSLSTQFSFDVFDYREDYGPNLRLATYFQLWNVFFARAAYEDMVSKKNTQAFSFGAGMKFSDEDLKSFVGLFL